MFSILGKAANHKKEIEEGPISERDKIGEDLVGKEALWLVWTGRRYGGAEVEALPFRRCA